MNRARAQKEYAAALARRLETVNLYTLRDARAARVERWARVACLVIGAALAVALFVSATN